MYNAAVISVFDEMDIGLVECKNLVVIPLSMKGKDERDIFKLLQLQQRDGFQRLLAVKFVRVKNMHSIPKKEFEIVKEKHYVLEESDWYINPTYDEFELKQIDKLADPVILLRSDKRRVKYLIGYYVNLRRRGYSEEAALSIIYS